MEELTEGNIQIIIDPEHPEQFFDRLNALETKTIAQLKFVPLTQVSSTLALFDRIRSTARAKLAEHQKLTSP